MHRNTGLVPFLRYSVNLYAAHSDALAIQILILLTKFVHLSSRRELPTERPNAAIFSLFANCRARPERSEGHTISFQDSSRNQETGPANSVRCYGQRHLAFPRRLR